MNFNSLMDYGLFCIILMVDLKKILISFFLAQTFRKKDI